MPYYIYGKRTKTTRYYSPLGSTLVEPDTMFRALDKNGCRVNTLTNAAIYETKEEAQRIIDKYSRPAQDGVLLEIRKKN